MRKGRKQAIVAIPMYRTGRQDIIINYRYSSAEEECLKLPLKSARARFALKTCNTSLSYRLSSGSCWKFVVVGGFVWGS